MISHPRKIENAGNTPRQKNKTMTTKEEICGKNCEKVENLLSKISKPAKPHFKNIETCKATHANSSIAHPELALIMKMARTAHRKDQKSKRHA